MADQNYDVAVIGAGLGGLTAGARLAQEGYRVLVVEQHYIPGGCATTFKRRDFVMEVGLHEMDGLHAGDLKRDVFRKLGIVQHIAFKKVPELYRAVSVDGKVDYTVPDDGREKVIAKLNAQFPATKDRKAIRRFFRILYGIYCQLDQFSKLGPIQRLLAFPFIPPRYPYLATYSNARLHMLARINPLLWLFHPTFVFKKFHTLGTLLDSLSDNETLKNVLCANLGYYHDDPYTMSLVFFAAAQVSYYEGGGWFVKGGSQKLSNDLVRIITDHGGTVLLGRRVTDIVIKGRRVTGIKYHNAFNPQAGKEEIKTHALVANAAPAHIAAMLPAAQAEKLTARVVDRHENSCSLLSVYMGFKSHLAEGVNKGGAYSTFILAQNQDSSLKQRWRGIKTLDPGDRDFVFVDYSQIDSGLTVSHKTVGTLCSIGYLSDWDGLSETRYRHKKDQVAQKMFARLDRVIPGIRDEIEYYEVGTPRTIASYTLNPAGSPYGFAQTPDQSGLARMYGCPDLNNLYFSSAWGFPGGGFTGAFLAGDKTSRAIMRRHKPDPAIEKHPVKDEKTSSRLLERKYVADHTMELVFEKPPFFDTFRSGQYAILSLDHPVHDDLDMPLRSLSMLSHPDEPVLRFAMRESQSAFKRSCLAMKAGDSAKIYGPMGSFVLKKNSRKIVFLVSGIGITPVVPMLKELEKTGFSHDLYLFYSNRTKGQTSYHDEINQLQLTRFHYINRYTDRQSRIDDDLIKAQIGDFTRYDYYVVGTSSFLRSMLTLLQAHHVPAHHIHADDFG